MAHSACHPQHVHPFLPTPMDSNFGSTKNQEMQCEIQVAGSAPSVQKAQILAAPRVMTCSSDFISLGVLPSAVAIAMFSLLSGFTRSSAKR